MPYLTLTENLKLQQSPGLVASYDIQPGNRVGLFWDKHTHVYLLTYLPRTHTGPLVKSVSVEHSVPELVAECAVEVQTELHRRSFSIYQPL